MSKYEKYTVKNCPVVRVNQYHNSEDKQIIEYSCLNREFYSCSCWNDCLLKRIVKKCNYFKSKIMQDVNYKKGADMVANEVLNLLEIEEINE